MRWKCAVTFESPLTAAPATVRVTVDAGTVATATSRAVRMAKRQVAGRRWESLVVLVERAGGVADEHPAPEGPPAKTAGNPGALRKYLRNSAQKTPAMPEAAPGT